MMASLRSLFLLLLFFFLTLCTFTCALDGEAQSDPLNFFNGTNHDVYLEWYQNSGSQHYNKAIFLPGNNDPSQGAAVHWRIESPHIHLAVAARARGWVGFGIAENGGMRGADIVLFEASNSSTLTDAHVLDSLIPITDDCNNWILVNSHTEGGFLIFEAVRLLDTGDTQDRAIVNDANLNLVAHRVIAAWGDSTTVVYHGVNNRVRGTIRFYGESLDDQTLFTEQIQLEPDVKMADLRATNYSIKPMETEYYQLCFSKADLIAKDIPIDDTTHVIGFEPIVSQASSKYVHHFQLFGSSAQHCRRGQFVEVAYAWAPGLGPLGLPSQVGTPQGGATGYNSYLLEIHYNNPWNDIGVLDNSGVRLYYTSNKREHDLGVMIIGDPTGSLYGSPVGNGLASHTFDCPASCSTIFAGQELTVIRESLHMHQTGVSMHNRQIRDGATIHTGKVEYFDFEQQGTFNVMQEPFTVKAGDSFRTECYYNSHQGERFGKSSQDEMCLAYLFYYPRQILYGFIPYVCGYELTEFPLCNSQWETKGLNTTTELERSFGPGLLGETCKVPNITFPTPVPVSTMAPTMGTDESEPTTAPVLVSAGPFGSSSSGARRLFVIGISSSVLMIAVTV